MNKVVDLSSGRVKQASRIIRRHHEGEYRRRSTKAGVSNATVSRTFAHPEQVSEATRIKVQAAADALNFSIDRRGILKSGRTYRVALLIGSHAIEWFTAEIIAGLNDVLRDAGHMISSSTPSKAEARDAFFEEPSATTQMPCSYPLSASAQTK